MQPRAETTETNVLGRETKKRLSVCEGERRRRPFSFSSTATVAQDATADDIGCGESLSKKDQAFAVGGIGSAPSVPKRDGEKKK